MMQGKGPDNFLYRGGRGEVGGNLSGESYNCEESVKYLHQAQILFQEPFALIFRHAVYSGKQLMGKC